jgi:phage nucleotide-binding protein
MKVKSTKDIQPTKLNVLIYSSSGSGKTTAISTLPNKTLIVSKESGLLSLKDFNIDYVEPSSLSDIRKLLVSNDISEYDNIAFDSLTEIASMFLEEAQSVYPDDRQALKKWGYFGDSLTKFIKFTRDLNKNVVFTCLEKTTEDNLGRRFNVPDVQGQLSKKLPAFFDFVFSLQVIEKEDGEKIRAFLTQPVEGYICKDRSGKLDLYEKPDFCEILKKVFA